MIVYYKNMIASRHLWERERQRGKKFKKLFCDFVNSTDALGLSVLTLAFWYSSPSCMGPRGSFLFPAPYKSKHYLLKRVIKSRREDLKEEERRVFSSTVENHVLKVKRSESKALLVG